jgi:hypothetical protein
MLRREDQHRQMLRLSAAAAIQTYCGLGAVAAWDASALIPDAVQIELRDAAAGGISAAARREVLAIYRQWDAARAKAEPGEYPAFAEPRGSATRSPAGRG